MKIVQPTISKIKKHRKELAALLVVFAITIIAQAIAAGTWFEDDIVAVWVFDVGQGDSIFIDAPEAQILIDGGPDGNVIEKLSAVMPFWDRSIDVVINSHPHADHVTGLVHVLERYFVSEVWWTGQDYGSEVYVYFEDLAQGSFTLVGAGEGIDLGAGATLTVLWPESNIDNELLDDPNAGSIVALLEYGDSTILLTGDVGTDEELAIVEQLGEVDVLKVGHQGSMTSSHIYFLEAISPEYSVISVGENDYGHPSPIVIDRLESVGSTVLRTDLDGDVRILTDGGEPSVSTWLLSP
ncbi:MAG: MBL fold metallo-hydrolase [bacterium]